MLVLKASSDKLSGVMSDEIAAMSGVKPLLGLSPLLGRCI